MLKRRRWVFSYLRRFCGLNLNLCVKCIGILVLRLLKNVVVVAVVVSKVCIVIVVFIIGRGTTLEVPLRS